MTTELSAGVEINISFSEPALTVCLQNAIPKLVTKLVPRR